MRLVISTGCTPWGNIMKVTQQEHLHVLLQTDHIQTAQKPTLLAEARLDQIRQMLSLRVPLPTFVIYLYGVLPNMILIKS